MVNIYGLSWRSVMGRKISNFAGFFELVTALQQGAFAAGAAKQDEKDRDPGREYDGVQSKGLHHQVGVEHVVDHQRPPPGAPDG